MSSYGLIEDKNVILLNVTKKEKDSYIYKDIKDLLKCGVNNEI